MKILKIFGIIIIILIVSVCLSYILGKVETIVGEISNNPRFIGTYGDPVEFALTTSPNPERCQNIDTYSSDCEQFTQASKLTGIGFPFVSLVIIQADAPIGGYYGVSIHPSGTINGYIFLLDIIIWCTLFFILWMLIKKIFFKKSIISKRQK